MSLLQRRSVEPLGGDRDRDVTAAGVRAAAILLIHRPTKTRQILFDGRYRRTSRHVMRRIKHLLMLVMLDNRGTTHERTIRT